MSEIAVMTANVGNGLASDEQLIAAILAADADIVAIEELNRRQATVLDARLQDAYPWRAFFEDSYEGKGILSRLPMRDAQSLRLIDGRPDCIATIDLDGRDATVIVAHPRPPRVRRNGILFDRSSQRHIVQLGTIARDSAPAIMLGDFNMTPRHGGYARFRRLGLHDAFGDAGTRRGATFPIRFSGPGGLTRAGRAGSMLGRRRMSVPFVRFDYIWHTEEFETLAAWIGPDTGSDHLPVMARLNLKPDLE